MLHSTKLQLFSMTPSCVQNQHNLGDQFQISAQGTTLATSRTQLLCVDHRKSFPGRLHLNNAGLSSSFTSSPSPSFFLPFLLPLTNVSPTFQFVTCPSAMGQHSKKARRLLPQGQCHTPGCSQCLELQVESISTVYKLPSLYCPVIATQRGTRTLKEIPA